MIVARGSRIDSIVGRRFPSGRAWVFRTAWLLAAAGAVSAALRWGEARAVLEPNVFAEALGSGTSHLPTLLLVFQARDCPSHGALLQVVSALNQRGAVHGVAVGLDFPKDTSAARRLAEEAGLTLPFRSDLAPAAERLILGLGFRQTPVTLLLDGDGRVRLALPAPKDAAGRRVTERVLASHAEQLRNEVSPFVAPPDERTEEAG